MKKLFKAVLKSVGVVTVLYAIYNTTVHVWVSMSRQARQIRLQKDYINSHGILGAALHINNSVLEEAENEWRLFKDECL